MKQNYEIFLEFLKSIYIIRKHSHVSIKQARVTKMFLFQKNNSIFDTHKEDKCFFRNFAKMYL